jgi:transglutaminase-like putative cysteine protease
MKPLPVETEHRVFRSLWWVANIMLLVAILCAVWTGIREYSVRRYLSGFSDAIIPEAAPPQEKVQAIIDWMRLGPPRLEAPAQNVLSAHDPTDTLNYRQLLEVCGSATNAFINLSRSSGVQTRRLLLLTPDRSTKHVVAEVLLDGRWVIVDATYRVIMKDAQGNLLTRRELQNPAIFQEATSLIPNYTQEYDYQNFAHIRLSALPFHGFNIRRNLDRFLPGWDEYVDWSLLLERRSFLRFFISVTFLVALLILRFVVAFLADHHVRMTRFHLRENLARAFAAFFSTPEIK